MFLSEEIINTFREAIPGRWRYRITELKMQQERQLGRTAKRCETLTVETLDVALGHWWRIKGNGSNKDDPARWCSISCFWNFGPEKLQEQNPVHTFHDNLRLQQAQLASMHPLPLNDSGSESIPCGVTVCQRVLFFQISPRLKVSLTAAPLMRLLFGNQPTLLPHLGGDVGQWATNGATRGSVFQHLRL